MSIENTNSEAALPPTPCSRVVAVSSLLRLAEDLEAWAEARFRERKDARKEGREKPYHIDNHYCACGQEDAAQRIRDLIRDESFCENDQALASEGLPAATCSRLTEPPKNDV